MLSQEQTTSLLLRNQLALTAFFATVARSYHLAEDVFQEICIGALSKKEGFESAEHLLHWARLAGKNRSIDILRARDGKFVGLTDAVIERLAAQYHRVSESHQLSKQDVLRECIKGLTSRNYEILRLRYFEGRTSSAISEMLNRKIETVYQTITRIHKALGVCVQQKLSSAMEDGGES